MITYTFATVADEPFLYEVFASTRRDEFAPLGLPDAQLEMLLRPQFEMQRRSHRAGHPTAVERLVWVSGAPVGVVLTAETDEALSLVNIALLPEARNQGHGGRILRELQDSARRLARPIRLHVLKGGPAERFYARLGFRRLDDRAPYLAMAWLPD
jgi:ribosomal protein S18 acetylase RimI-like enzyme